jgi:hypothetical protein
MNSVFAFETQNSLASIPDQFWGNELIKSTGCVFTWLGGIKSRLNSGNACYYSVQNLLSSRLISKNLEIKIYKTVILPVVLYGCETWSLTLGEEHRLRVFENSIEEDI